MLSFDFYNPVKLVYGQGQVERIGELAKDWGKKALIVSYEESRIVAMSFCEQRS